jgi:POT family proton-dependent oligopeptide transporter
LLALFVSGFNPMKGKALTFVPEELIKKYEESGATGKIIGVLLHEFGTPAGLLLLICGIGALAYIGLNMRQLERIPRQRMYVVLTLTFFSLLFWAFFEQAGSSVNNFTDRNVKRVLGHVKTIAEADVGSTIAIQPTQEQLGFTNGDKLFTLNQLDKLREENKSDLKFTIDWKVAADNIGMNISEQSGEIPASWFQAINPVYILVFGLVFTALWAYLGKRGLEPSTPFKFSFGLLQLGLGFAAFWYGAHMADSRGMVAVAWLFLGYLLQTTGELCLSPVGLSMITKLTPAFLVSTVMGMWFLATAFSQFLAAIIAQFTSVSSGESGTIPPPIETVNVYGGVYGKIAIASLICGGICLLLAPLLSKWMHNEAISQAGDHGDA